MSLKFVLLTLLDRQPSTGYDLVRTFDTAVGYFWNASHQQVYRELGALSDAKLVKFKQVRQDDKPDKKVYSISSPGKKALHQWLEEPIKKSKTKELLLVKLLNTNSSNIALMQQELDRHIQRSTELRDTYNAIEKLHYSSKQLENLPGDQIMIYAALRKGILSIEANLCWLKEVQQLINAKF